MKMKNLALCAGMASMLFACSSNEDVPAVASEGLMINAYIGNQASTRAEKTTWSANDALGVFVTAGTLDKPYLGNATRYTNVNFRHNGKGFTAGSIYLDETPATVYAYFPYAAAVKTGTTIPVESTSQTDYLYGVSTTPASITRKNVDMRMKHALSVLTFKLRKAADYNEGACSLSKIVIENLTGKNDFKTAGNLNIQTGAITGTSTNGSVTLTPKTAMTLTDAFQNLSTIVLPVSETATATFQAIFTIDGRQYKFLFPAKTKWEGGTRNNYSLTMTNTGLEIGGGAAGSDKGITIEPWSESTDSDVSLVPIL